MAKSELEIIETLEKMLIERGSTKEEIEKIKDNICLTCENKSKDVICSNCGNLIFERKQ